MQSRTRLGGWSQSRVSLLHLQRVTDPCSKWRTSSLDSVTSAFISINSIRNYHNTTAHIIQIIVLLDCCGLKIIEVYSIQQSTKQLPGVVGFRLSGKLNTMVLQLPT
ncbi:uncharacterized protein LOC131241689 [Magnolia sinica]|uniref:uncharacterized protein LOC131241689 n=1 Tax=Magnolia sinica TaxID=86752 RepID=UPI00265A09DD|nr:uncharacterized protein LOC131241689 [Magnolia sinica]